MKDKNHNTTRDILYNQAKYDFYHNGFSKTTLKSIAEHANLQPSLFTYYFESKDSLVGCIFDDYYKSIMNLLNSLDGIKDSNALLKQMLCSYIYYSIILGDENNKRFFKDIKLTKESNYSYHKDISDEIYWAYVKEFGIRLSKKDFEVYSVMRSSSRTAFFRYYFANQGIFHIYEIVQYLESIAPKLMGISSSVIEYNLIQCSKLIKEIDYSSIKFLV